MSGFTTGRMRGLEAVAEGIQNDSFGFLIDPDAYYEFECIGTIITALWRTGIRKPSPAKRIICTKEPDPPHGVQPVQSSPWRRNAPSTARSFGNWKK